MGLRIEREKPRHLLDSVIYRLLKLPVSGSAKFIDNDHVTEFDRDEVADLLRQGNIKVIRSEYIFGIQRYSCEVA